MRWLKDFLHNFAVLTTCVSIGIIILVSLIAFFDWLFNTHPIVAFVALILVIIGIVSALLASE